MNKFLLVFYIITAINCLIPYKVNSDDWLLVKYGIDIDGRHDFVNPTGYQYDVENKPTIALEYIFDFDNDLCLGIGSSLQYPRAIYNSYAEFEFSSIYGLMKIKSNYKKVSPVVNIYLGCSMYGGNLYYTLGSELSGGLYYGLGLGVSAPSYELELLYSVNMGKMEGFYYNGYSLYNYIYDVEYRKVTILLGYKL